MAARARPLPFVGRLRDGARVGALLVALVAFTLYVATLVPGPLGGDSGEFQYMPRVLGLPHPTGFPLYLLLGWLWSWLPLGTLAFRMNLFSVLCAALAVGLLFMVGREQGFRRVAALGGALALALAPGFWRYAVVAEVYTLHALLLVGALFGWLRWSAARCGEEPGQWRWLWVAAFATGLGLTNHPTFAFVVPAALLFLVGHLVLPSRLEGKDATASRGRWRGLLVAAMLFALPGLLYLYVPLRLWQLDTGGAGALSEPIARGVLTPFIRAEWGWDGVVHYILDRSYTGNLRVEWGLLPSRLPGVLLSEFGLVVGLLGAGGALLWAWRSPRTFLPLATLFLLSAVYGVRVLAALAGIEETLDPVTVLLPAMLVFALWAGRGVEGLVEGVSRLTRRPAIATGLGAVVLVLALGQQRAGAEVPTAADRVKSEDIRSYWTEVLAYPLEEGAALTGHWGDLTPFWYFQHGEGRRPDLRAIFPPDVQQMESWLAERERPLYLAGPLINWSPELVQRYSLTPWGILVRVAQPGTPVSFPPLQARPARFGGQLQLEGYQVEEIEPGRKQLWLAWRTVAPTSRDLSVSVRLHGPDGASLYQEDGRLASLWYPEGTMPPDQPLLTVFDLDVPGDLPSGVVGRIVVYDPATGQPLLTAEGQDVFELGPFQ